VALTGLLGLSALAACDPIDDPLAGQVPATGVDTVGAQLDALAVGEWAPMAGYSRDRFEHWISQGDGCDTRDRVLQRDGQGVSTGDDCHITGGTWFSVYDGQTFTDPSDIDIDHVVPLANAWRTGAAAWSDEERSAFANDLERPQLIAVSASSNRSKGDQDPSEWQPPRHEYWCPYAQSWIAVKSYWQLSVTVDEKEALTEMLGTCS
jgi:5-methylcytosine-specific restriction endonuclease McrA